MACSILDFIGVLLGDGANSSCADALTHCSKGFPE
jgi:hypothetical protein